MKQIAILMSAVLSLTLFSFLAVPDNGVAKTAAHLYEVAPVANAKVNKSDKDAFMAIIKKEYKLDDAAIKKGVVLASTSRTGFCIIEKSIGENWFTKRAVYMDAIAVPGGSQSLDAILAKYVPKPIDKATDKTN